MIRLVRTSTANPEQYDAFAGTVQVGYLRLKRGTFLVECPKAGGQTVYVDVPNGVGEFEAQERDHYLHRAIFAIQEWRTGTSLPSKIMDLEYEIVGNGPSKQ